MEVRLRAGGLPGGRARVRGNISSQYLSALLMAAPLAAGDVVIEVVGTLVSVPYVEDDGRAHAPVRGDGGG